MHILKRQQGFTLLELAIVLAVIGVFVATMARTTVDHRVEQDAENFGAWLAQFKTQIAAYQLDQINKGVSVNSGQIFPTAFNSLEPLYMPACSGVDAAAGYCRANNLTPWDSTMQIVAQPSFDDDGYEIWRLYMSIPLPANTGANTAQRSALMGAMLNQGARYRSDIDAMELWIDRLDTGLRTEALVKRSGDNSTLTGDWDVGGEYALTNATNYYVTTANGGQQSLIGGILYAGEHKDGDIIPKPNCPTGYKATAQSSLKAILAPTDDPADKYFTTSMEQTDIIDLGSSWSVYLRYWALKGENSDWIQENSGTVNIQAFCTEN